MARVLGLWFWITTAAVVAVGGATAIDWGTAMLAQKLEWGFADEIDVAPRWLAIAVALVFSSALHPRARRFLLRVTFIRPLFRHFVFDDLDGEWKVRVESNWPTIKAMLNASKGEAPEPFDPCYSGTKLPEPSVFEFDAQISMGWEKTAVTVTGNPASPLLKSRTFAVELLRENDDFGRRVFWGFRQFNASVASTDDDNFLGAAMLDVVSENELEGVYWNNRSWRSGLNAAGRITMHRKK